MRQSRIGSLAVIVTALLWSADDLLRRHLYTLPSPVIVFWEHSFGFLLLLPFLFITRKSFAQLTRKQWGAIVLVALLSGATGTILYTAALGRITYIPFSVVVLLQQLNPIFAIATATALLRERLSQRFLALSVVALIGAYLVTFPHLRVNLATGTGTLIAALMAVAAAASWGTATAFSKYALKGTSFPHITALRFGFTIPFALLFATFSGSASKIGSITGQEFMYLLLITFSTGLVALLIYYYGLQKISASRASILELAWPMSSVLIGYLFLHQGLTVTQLLGAITLLATTYLLARKPKEKTVKTKDTHSTDEIEVLA
jgi:drug/metabolite transporter (DMT)-like permease